VKRDPFPRMADKIPEGSVGSARVKHFVVTEADARFSALRAMIQGRSSEMVSPGRYAKLIVDGQLMMSDEAVRSTGGRGGCGGAEALEGGTDMERKTNRLVIEHAKGHVLIGMVVFALLAKKPAIRSLLVLEESQDIIALIQPHLPKDARLTIAQEDVFGWDGWQGRAEHGWQGQGRWGRRGRAERVGQGWGGKARSSRRESPRRGRAKRGPQFGTIYFDIWPSIHAGNLAEVELLRTMAAGRLARGGWLGDWDTEYRRGG
jgi:hypothetical protein